MKEFPLPEVPLEDEFNDVIAKAQRGLGLGNRELCERAKISEDKLARIQKGIFDEETVRELAEVLHLGADALVILGRGVWYPRLPEPVTGLAMVNTPFGDMAVNAYVAWSLSTREAFVFDTGGDASPLLAIIRREELKVQAILLTHTHRDHVADLDRLCRETSAPVFVHESEVFEGAEGFFEGKKFSTSDLTVSTFLTSGHARGGITYLIAGLEFPVAITGDAIFAASMGGGLVSYQDALENNRKKIMTLPDHTLLCPGHGPATTVAQEKQHNAFFP
jgi:glyoxylase-like metal-dependent hydrolase (beta-lactamase superfamily II)